MSGIITFIAGMLGAAESGTRLLLSLFSGKVLVVAVADFQGDLQKNVALGHVDVTGTRSRINWYMLGIRSYCTKRRTLSGLFVLVILYV